MCIISLDRERFRLLFDVLFVTVPFIDPEISPFYQSDSAPLVSILKGPAISLTDVSNVRLRIDYGDSHVVRSSSTKRVISQLWIMIS